MKTLMISFIIFLFSISLQAQMNMALASGYIQENITKIATNITDISNLTDGTTPLTGLNMSVVIVTTGTYTTLAANTGRIHVIPDLAGNTTINLPVEAAGLNYTFWYVGGVAEAHDHIIDSGADVNFFIGGISFLDIDAGDAADEVHAGLYSDGNSNSKFTINNASAGTIIKLVSDGTNWYITGQVLSDTVPAFADQP